MDLSNTANIQKPPAKNVDGFARSLAASALRTQARTPVSEAPNVQPVIERPKTAGKRRQAIIAKVRCDSPREIYAVAPDDDVDGFRRRLKEIFATASPLFVEASMRQLIAAAKLPNQSIANTVSLSSSLELIASLEPETEAEAALAIHIACLHLATLNILSRLHGVTERNVIAMTTAAAKIERTFQLALETYTRLKHGITQTVRVERVEVQPGGQAIVGCVSRPHGGG